jgi:hypothetical protein
MVDSMPIRRFQLRRSPTLFLSFAVRIRALGCKRVTDAHTEAGRDLDDGVLVHFRRKCSRRGGRAMRAEEHSSVINRFSFYIDGVSFAVYLNGDGAEPFGHDCDCSAAGRTKGELFARSRPQIIQTTEQPNYNFDSASWHDNIAVRRSSSGRSKDETRFASFDCSCVGSGWHV